MIPDLAEAVESPRTLSSAPDVAGRLLDLVPLVPTPVWGRDERRTGEMWNSNSLISWLLVGAGIDAARVPLPPGGRAPGWNAGIAVATRTPADAPLLSAYAATVEGGRDEGQQAAGDRCSAWRERLIYEKLLRAPMLTWGATSEEARARFPGDELLEDADGVATRAITIEAPASAVWPWIAQMGPSPAVAPTPMTGSRTLGLNMHSTDRVLPEFQQPRVGDGFGYGANKMTFAIVEPNRVLATCSADGNWIWTFILHEQNGRMRLISRNRFRLPTLKDRIGMIPMEPGSLVMERKMLLGIKQRAEHLAVERGDVTGRMSTKSAAHQARPPEGTWVTPSWLGNLYVTVAARPRCSCGLSGDSAEAVAATPPQSTASTIATGASR